MLPGCELCYNQHPAHWRYRLGVRTEDSQSSNPGSIPGSATISILLPPDIPIACCVVMKARTMSTSMCLFFVYLLDVVEFQMR